MDFIESSAKDDDDPNKRRSGRHTQRKKYVDDVDLNLSEDENLLMNLPSDVAAEIEGADTKSGTVTPKEGLATGGTETPKVPPSDENSKDELPSGPNYAYVVIFSPLFFEILSFGYFEVLY